MVLAWIAANYPTILICTLLIVIVAAVIANMISDRKKGKSSCGCGCAVCPMRGSCHSKND